MVYMSDHRVAITGIGIVSAMGIGYEQYAKGLRKQKSFLTRDDVKLKKCIPFNRMAVIENFEIQNFLQNTKIIKNLNRANQFALVAAQLALKDAGWLDDRKVSDERKGLYYLNGISQVCELDIREAIENSISGEQFSYNLFRNKGIKLINPILPIRSLPNIGLWAISKTFQLKGNNTVMCPFASEGAMLLEEAKQSIINDRMSMCLIGGADAPFNISVLSSVLSMCRDARFSKSAVDLTLGEGAVFLVLEDLCQAKQKGKNIYGCIGNCASVNVGSPGWNLEKFETGYRYMLEKQCRDTSFEVAISANNGVKLMEQAEKKIWDELIERKNKNLKVFSFMERTGYLLASSFFLDICSLCIIMNHGYQSNYNHLESTKIRKGLVCCMSISLGLASVLIEKGSS